MKLSERKWQCKYCGTVHDRDVLAANNIKRFGLKNKTGQDMPKLKPYRYDLALARAGGESPMSLDQGSVNRYGWFISDSSVRASLEWERFCTIAVPVPDIKIQEAIVTIYHTLEARKKINEQLKDSIKPLCPVLMKGVVENYKLEKV